MRKAGAALFVIVGAAFDSGALGAAEPATLPVLVSGSLQNPAFSPDGDELLFTSFETAYNEGPSALYVFDFVAGTHRLLTSAPDSDNVNLPGSAWVAAGGRICFSSDRQDAEEIWTVAADGSDAQRVTNHVGTESYLEPSFSPDGQWIVFEISTPTGGGERQGALWKVRANGSDLTRLTGGPGATSDDRQPNWSPDGTRIVFQRREGASDDWDLFTMAIDGSNVVQVTTSPGGDSDASWSPDGWFLVYSSDQASLLLPNLFYLPANGGVAQRITDDETRYDGAPSWSPDGAWIAYESRGGDPDGSPGTELRVVLAPPLPLFADGFESGNTDAWSSAVL